MAHKQLTGDSLVFALAKNPTESEAVSSLRHWGFTLSLLASVLFWMVSWYWDTAASMASIWWHSDTFAHGMLVYPISIWLVWRKRKALQRLPVKPSLFAALLVVVAANAAWLLGELGRVQAARHFGLVAMIAGTVWCLLGTRVARAIAFPLMFTLLAVPVGEFLVPVLIEHTADFTVGALRVTGIPVFREGNNFVIPSGAWSVVEACSGLRYLIASITLGVLYAYLSYRSALRRAIFIFLSVLVPILANWVRAYLIVMLGHLSSMKLAVGVDHLVYGWVFFGLVMLLLFWLGSLWREDDIERDDRAILDSSVGHAPPSAALIMAGVLVAAGVSIAPSYSSYLDEEGYARRISMDSPRPSAGWEPISGTIPLYRPGFTGARVFLEQSLERAGQRVDVYIGYYAGQRRGAELISYHNSLVATNNRHVRQLDQIEIPGALNGASVVQTRLVTDGGDLMTWHVFWVGGHWTVHPQVAKWRLAVNKLLDRGDDAALIVISTRSSERIGASSALLQSFASDMGEAIGLALARTRASSSIPVNDTADAQSAKRN